MTTSPYNYEFDVSGETTAAKVCSAVGFGKEILELGCAYGSMTRVLNRHYNCRVVAVEFDSVAAEAAREYCDELILADLRSDEWSEKIGERKFDVIVIADVLEHLVDPLKCLKKAAKYLRPAGYIVLSIPNVAHNGIIAELFAGDFEYRDVGLLDRTHVHFFAREGISRLLSDAGLHIDRLLTHEVPARHSEFANKWRQLPLDAAKLLEARPDGDVYQYIIIASKRKATGNTGNTPAGLRVRGQSDTRTGTVFALERNNEELGRENEDLRTEAVALKKELHAVSRSLHVALERADSVQRRLEQVVSSRSWRITRPVRFAARVYRHGFLSNDIQKLEFLVKSLYRHLPIPAATRPFVKKFGRYILRKLGLTSVAVGPRNVVSVPILPANHNTPDYFLFGVIDWNFRHQRPQQLARQIAKTGRRVFYVSVTFNDSPTVGYTIEPIDSSGRLFNVHFCVRGAPKIYAAPPSKQSVEQLKGGLARLLADIKCTSTIAMVQHPFWRTIANLIPNSRLVYDCMDHHQGFGGVSTEMINEEAALLADTELVVTTSQWLNHEVSQRNVRTALIRNATEFEHFNIVPTEIYHDPSGRRIIGYYGAIAEWFDVELMSEVAAAFPQCLILLVGNDTVNAARRLSQFSNVVFTGEIPYLQLPFYAHAFDVCLLPFKVIPLTLATNPVKVYEYLSMGKPVISTDLPEVREMGRLCSVSLNTKSFVENIRRGLSDPGDAGPRQAFAKDQTWAHRAEELIERAESTAHDPLVSVIVLTYNNLELTRACLQSLDAHSDYANIEIVVVDNASTDNTPEFLSAWVSMERNRKLILNQENRGFAAGNNDGLKVAAGEYLILLNNDTYVTPGWMRTLVNHMRRDDTIGLIGPVTNNIGNEAKIEIQYNSMPEMIRKASLYTTAHLGGTFDLRTLAFFCVMIPRKVYRAVGGLDEAFGRGFFEDDDYCRRVESHGLRVVCAEDVFVHHHLSASFNKLNQNDRQRIFDENKAIYEKKWGKWTPHTYRSQ